jgi:hypothetical protein
MTPGRSLRQPGRKLTIAAPVRSGRESLTYAFAVGLAGFEPATP